MLYFSDIFAGLNLIQFKMSGSKHNRFRLRLFSILFLFLNCVCTAAPVIKNTSEAYKQAISLQRGLDFNALETGEENRLATSSIINHSIQFLYRKYNKHSCNKTSYATINVLPFQSWEHPSITVADFLPTPGYYTFLFRYKPF
jgi:hypothetical protein